MDSELVVYCVPETGYERLLSSDEVSQSSLDPLQSVLAKALEYNRPVSFRCRFWLQAKVDRGKMHARLWHGDEASRVVLIEMTVRRTMEGEMPLLEVNRVGTHATRVAHELGLEVGDLVSRIAWCWLLRSGR